MSCPLHERSQRHHHIPYLLLEILGLTVHANRCTFPHQDDMSRAIALFLMTSSPATFHSASFPLEPLLNSFCSNARRRTNDTVFSIPLCGRINEWTAESFVKDIQVGKSDAKLAETFGSRARSAQSRQNSPTDDDRKMPALTDPDNIINLLDDDDDQNESLALIEVLGVDGWASMKSIPL